MEVTLIPKNDRNHILKNGEIRKIIQLIVSDKKLISYVGSVILDCYTYNDLKERIEDDTSMNYAFISSNYSLISALMSVYKTKGDLGDLRGGILEFLVFNLIKKKYIKSKNFVTHVSCKIKIDGSQVGVKSSDVVFWCKNTSAGDSIECKICAEKFNLAHIKHAHIVHSRSKKSIRPSFVSFSAAETISKYVKSEFPREEIDYISFYGNDNMYNLTSLKFCTN
ncbi:MAG: hypothetical protein AABX82_06785 [Nanoarchaeota archaeon]